jgi:hypothetical protein
MAVFTAVIHRFIMCSMGNKTGWGKRVQKNKSQRNCQQHDAELYVPFLPHCMV